ncbi:ABC transporter substrate-binding protein [Polaromonas jejuensis]|uniref:ABC transporter substrate-binding protein n=1 Tax=Polaromonas jejuensis TaxID=457502 RepID=A0ABW0QC81_9BURK|nr:ABC transporter substrate-binding protein [Polaromonas jejuensis]
MQTSFKTLIGTLALSAAALATAQTVPVFGLVELSGTGATSGSNFDNGIKLAVKEINAAGGILGRKVSYVSMDTQSNPGVAKALAQKAVDQGAYVVMGPVFSGSIMVSMAETRRAEIPNFTGGEAASITQQGNPYIFRTSFTQSTAMPKVAAYIHDTVKARTVDVIYVNNDFGKGGLDLIKKELEARGIKVPNSISTDPGQLDFSAPVLKARQSGSDAVFVYSNEEESARALRELRKQGYTKPMIGETVLTSQKVIELAGDAANGAVAHVGLTADAPQPLIKKFSDAFFAEYKIKSDHNGLKGYSGMYLVKAVTEKIGKFDPKAFAAAMKGVTLSVKDHPGILMDVSFDQNGDLDRESYMTRVENGKQVVSAILPPVGRK